MILFLLTMLLLLMVFMQVQHRSNLVRIGVGVVQGIPLQRPVEARCSAVKRCLACARVKSIYDTDKREICVTRLRYS